MKHLLAWLRFVARLVLAYAAIGLGGAGLVMICVSIYADPVYLIPFAAGVFMGGGRRRLGRWYKGFQARGGLYSFVQGMHSVHPAVRRSNLHHTTG